MPRGEGIGRWLSHRPSLTRLPSLRHRTSSASNEASGTSDPEVLEKVQARYQELKVAVKNYHEYLKSVGV